MTGSTNMYLLLFVFAITIMAFTFAVIIIGQVNKSAILVSRRIDTVVERKKIEEKRKQQKKKKRGSGSSNGSLSVGGQINSSFLQKIGDYIFEELMAANIMMKPEECALLWVVIIVVPAFLAFVFSGNPFLPFVLAGLGFAIPIIIVKQKQQKRIKAFESQLSDALLICCNCLKSGLTFVQAMENIAKEMDDPIGTEFRRACNEMTYGASMDDALENMVTRINSADLSLTVAAVGIQKQTGGNLSEILEIIAKTIRDRIKLKAEVKVLTTQGKYSGIIIGALPIFLGVVLFVISPDYMMLFFETSIGKILLGVSALLEIIGFTVINKIVEIKI